MSYMVRKSLLISLFLCITSLLFSMQAFADELEGSSRETVLRHIQNAFDSQVSLTETARSKEEIKRILSTYFENDFIEKYMKENVHALDDQFIVYGTDFPMYTIPFFTYDENTKVFEHGSERIVSEFFPASSEGPVTYSDHYEVVKMHNTSKGWKIYSIENEVKHQDFVREKTILLEEFKLQIGGNEFYQTGLLNTENTSKDYAPFKQVLGLNHASLEGNQSFKDLYKVFFVRTYGMQSKSIFNDYYLAKRVAIH
ncbi:DUF3993 domain-containing protein [Metabacillus rhizolycopersici]|uniref:DUF3993 domain-containing protein n=1 Tax=Metabacillus rhizolycopersici TaxID=2875709 RepID=A0ABS7ULP4_9BACI|nr:DUF3993 domain-containing protein [Metabacillus rhizolycopersici]MBZ5748840.1 DUF3993 domain-containing protein [Metabacillus rhizolycopersici]